MSEVPVPGGKGGWNVNPRLAERWGDRALEWVGKMLSEGRYDATETFIEKIGQYALMVAAVVGLLHGIVGGIKSDSLSNFLMGLGWVPLVAIMQYVAAKFSSAGDLLIRSSPSELSSRAFLLCIGLLSMVVGLLLPVGLTVAAIRTDSWSLFGMAVGIFVICELVVCLCLHPNMLNIEISPVFGAGQEAIGVLTFFIKVPVRLVPIVFGCGAILGTLGMGWALIDLFRGSGQFNVLNLPAAEVVLAAAAVPLVYYILFILCYLNMDLIRAVLSVPAKLDALKDRRAG
jgi:hypothetical protein